MTLSTIVTARVCRSHGLFLVLERIPLFRKKRLKVIDVPLTIIIVLIGWVLFRADTPAAAWSYLKAMAGFGGTLGITGVTRKITWAAFAAGVLGCLPWLPWLKGKIHGNARLEDLFDLLGVIAAVAVLVLSAFLLIGGTYNPFIYFRF